MCIEADVTEALSHSQLSTSNQVSHPMILKAWQKGTKSEKEEGFVNSQLWERTKRQALDTFGLD